MMADREPVTGEPLVYVSRAAALGEVAPVLGRDRVPRCASIDEGRR